MCPPKGTNQTPVAKGQKSNQSMTCVLRESPVEASLVSDHEEKPKKGKKAPRPCLHEDVRVVSEGSRGRWGVWESRAIRERTSRGYSRLNSCQIG